MLHATSGDIHDLGMQETPIHSPILILILSGVAKTHAELHGLIFSFTK
jgi:hypothetical protein